MTVTSSPAISASDAALTDAARADVASALRTVAAERAALDALAAAFANGLGAPFARAVAMIRASRGRLIITGMGKSGHVGRKIAATMASTGTPAYFVHPAEASHGDLGMVQPEDVILAMSWSGETTELSDIIAYSRRFRIPLLALTSRPDSTLARQADLALILPAVDEACPNGMAPTSSTTLQMVTGDALAIALLEGRGFTRQDFRVYHPGGKLGAQLRTVREIMHTGARLPVVRDDAILSEAIAEISTKGFGCVLVVDGEGRLAGIITDGDLRRNFRPDMGSAPVTGIMTRNPRTVTPDTLLASALEMQERSKITALVVMENGRIAGLVHYLDLLRAGVA
ncbi:SIS domain-containing protein [Camelimonas abortus]|uniref:SIS domain-containing protein n=1 Tax=Camelimonas abortus TaxID=1017184 RepID=A0ABV7LFC0_9HYPH